MMTQADALKMCEVRVVELPACCNGFVTEMPAGRFVICLNSQLPAEERDRVLRHELAHVRLGHFDQDNMSIQEIEQEADLLAAMGN